MMKRLNRAVALVAVGLMIAVVSCADDAGETGEVQGKLNELDRTVVALGNEVADIRTGQSGQPDLSGELNELNREVAALRDEAADIRVGQPEQSDLSDGLNELNREVAALRDEVADVRTSPSDLRAAPTLAPADLTDISDEIAAIAADWDSVASELAALKQVVESQRAKIRELESVGEVRNSEFVGFQEVVSAELERNSTATSKAVEATDEALAGIQVFSDELSELHDESDRGQAQLKILQDGLELLSVELAELWTDVDAFEKRVEGTNEVDESGSNESGFTLQLLHASDMDGSTGALQNVENFSALLDGFRRQYPNNTLVLSSGDNYIPGPRFDAAGDDSTADVLGIPGAGRGDIALLNAMGFQASAIGNHELDRGTGSFASLVAAEVGDETYVGAMFPYLSSNLRLADDDNLQPLVVADGQEVGLIGGSLARSATITVGGERIGIVGATTPYLRRLTNVGGIAVAPVVAGDFGALAAEIQTAIDALLSQGIDKVILLSHMQEIEIEMELASMLRGVDIVVAGGSNTILADENDLLRDRDEAWGDYPLAMRSATGEPVLVVNTDADYRYLGRLVVDFDEWGVLIPESVNEFVSGAYSTETQGGQTFSGRPIPEVSEIVDALTSVMRERGGNVVGKTNVYLAGLRPDVRTQETNLGNLVTDAYVWLARMVDPDVAVGLKNSGGIRDHIGLALQPPGTNDPKDIQYLPPPANELSGTEEGDISQLAVQGVLRFNNALVILPLTAAQLVEAMEHSIGYEGVGEVYAGRFPQVSGMRFSFDPARPSGDRVRSLAIVNDEGEVIDRVVENGELVGDAARVIKVATINFIANGGDGYPFPSPLEGRVDLAGEAVQFNAPNSEFPDTNSNGVIDVAAGVDPGLTDFADVGTEQEALAEYLAHFFGEMPFDEAETSPLDDRRVQNLGIPGKADTVFE